MNERKSYFWQLCRHGTAVELFTLIMSLLMPGAVWNQSSPSGHGNSLMWPAFVVCVRGGGYLKGGGQGKKRKPLEY